MTKQQQIEALREIVNTVSDAIREAGSAGMPEGPLYAMLMTYGCNLSQFQTLVGAMVRSGKVRKSGNVLYAC